jgi:hypothetical protein
MNHCIIHVTHSSRNIPETYRDQFLIDDNALNFELDKLTDHFTDSMTEGVEANKIIFTYSRLLVDVEAKLGVALCVNSVNVVTTFKNRIQRIIGLITT